MMNAKKEPGLAPGSLLIALQQFSVRYEDRTVLDRIDFQWKAGESVLVVGPSGSGKSTLAMVLAGLVPGAVEAEISGEQWRHPQIAGPGRIGMVFQDPESQFCQMSAGQEIAFGLENIKMAPAEMDARIRAALEEARLDVGPGALNLTFSGGMKQKLALAAALAPKPDVVILDEPTANLDPAGTAAIFREIVRMGQAGRTLMVIEHKFRDLADAMPSVLLMDRAGKIHAQGPTREILSREWFWMKEQGLVPLWWTGVSLKPVDANDLQTIACRQEMPESGPPVMVAQDLRFSYGRKASGPEALHGLSFQINEGERVVIAGPNGSGKSTLLNLLAGLSRPSSGLLSGPGRDPGEGVPVVLGFQNPEHQFVYERVVDELSDGYVGDVRTPEVRGLLQDFGLSGYEEHSPFALSQGQKRRLGVAVMMKDDHRVYILDEPTFGQDARTQEAIVAQLEGVSARGRTVVITTHDMDLAARFASRVIVLIAGKVVFDGLPSDLFANPALMASAGLLAQAHVDECSQPQAGSSGATRGWSRFAEVSPVQQQSFMGQLNPSLKLITTILAMGIAMFASRIATAAVLALLPLILMVGAARMRPGQIVRRMAPFVAFFILYTWTLTAYSRVGPHTPVFYFLWYRLSWEGFDNGLVLAFRMLASVAFGVLFVSTTDLTALIVSLTVNLRVPPRFSYGSLAGIRVFPLFEEEWRTIRQARQLRGKEGRWRVARIATYALPLLSRAVRTGERVAIAMEARGFQGEAAASRTGRTYYQDTPAGWRDGIYLAGVSLLSLAILIWVR